VLWVAIRLSEWVLYVSRLAFPLCWVGILIFYLNNIQGNNFLASLRSSIRSFLVLAIIIFLSSFLKDSGFWVSLTLSGSLFHVSTTLIAKDSYKTGMYCHLLRKKVSCLWTALSKHGRHFCYSVSIGFTILEFLLLPLSGKFHDYSILYSVTGYLLYKIGGFLGKNMYSTYSFVA
jgi:hypothetical protein